MTLPVRELVFWAAAAACVLAEAAILISSFRALRGNSRKSAAREALWAVLPAIALSWILAATWSEMHRMSAHHRMDMPSMPSG